MDSLTSSHRTLYRVPRREQDDFISRLIRKPIVILAFLVLERHAEFDLGRGHLINFNDVLISHCTAINNNQGSLLYCP